MSIFEDGEPVNTDIPAGNASHSFSNGFVDSIVQSYNYQINNHSMYSIESGIRDNEEHNINLARKYGVDVSSIEDSEPIGQKVATAATGVYWNHSAYWHIFHPRPFQEVNQYDDTANKNDKIFAELAEKHPDAGFYPSYQAMGEAVTKKMRLLEKQNNVTSNGLTGGIGSFIGSTAAGLNPIDHRNDPFLTAAMMVPNFFGGSGIAARVAGTAATGALQGEAEDLLGVSAEREAAGLPNSSVARNLAVGAGIGLAGGLAGEAFRGIGKLLDRVPEPSVPKEEAPIPDEEVSRNGDIYDTKPYGDASDARVRIDEDVDNYQDQMDNINGPSLDLMDRRSSSAIAETPDDRASLLTNGNTVDDIAREVDPQLIGEYDDISQEADSLEQRIAEGAEDKADLEEQLKDLNDRKQELAPLVKRAYDIAGQTESLRAPATTAEVRSDRILNRNVAKSIRDQTDKAVTYTKNALPEEDIPEEITLPSGRKLKLNDVVGAYTDPLGENTATLSVKDMMQDMKEQHALDEAAKHCAL